MDPTLALRRRVLAGAIHRYVEADLAWRAAAVSARAWFPREQRPHLPPIGDPGSRLRNLHERRERALLRMIAARERFEAARHRAARRKLPPAHVVLLIGSTRR